METDCDQLNDVEVIRISGDLNGSSVGAVADRAYSALVCRQHQVLLNLANVSQIDAAGLGLLAHVHSLATIVDASVTLTNVNSRVRELLDVVGLSACFDIAASECEALEDLERRRPTFNA
jgi:anti-anti-sigma factor